MNRKVKFNNDWVFAKTGLEVTDYHGLDFQPVEIPHDWLIYDTQNLYQDSIGWYKKAFTYNGEAPQVLLAFDGVYMDSTLYVNGQLVGEWKYGYSAFEHDLTPALVVGENEIILKVVHQSPNSRWYSGAGIYRHVWLKTRGTSYIESDGIYVSTKLLDKVWRVEIETELNVTEPARLTHLLLRHDQVIAKSSDLINPANSDQQINSQQLTVVQPELWSPDQPNLYQLRTELCQVEAEEIIDLELQEIGFRTVDMDPKQGLMINGQKTKINGVCEHHDLGALGAAFNRVALVRRLKLLKEMGVNGIRTAHNMPAKELMQLADQMGFFVVSEAFDMWERQKTSYDYARFFKEWAYRDVKSWIKRDRNHPSLIMWSIGNEIYDTHADQRGQIITQMLMDYVNEFDPKHNGRVTIGSNYMPWENAQKCADIVKVAGYNYAEKYYQSHHQAHPDWVIYGSETASVVQSRGVYHFPYNKPILADDDEQCSALGNSTTSWGAKSAEACIIAERDTPFSLGQFIWTGFDYIGEPTPYHTKNSYFGQLDTATFPKDSYYIYQAAWTDYRKQPIIHLFPYWDFNEGQIIDVRVATNAPKVELFLNGQSLGVKVIDHQHGKELVPTWQVPYQAGELKAIAYDDDNQVIATDSKHSFSDAKALVARPDKNSLQANGTDLIFVEITAVDQAGHPVENATNRVEVSVTGAGRLVGLDNGDSTDYDQYKGTSRRLFSGKLMAIIAATEVVGDIHVMVNSPRLVPAELKLEAIPPAADQSIACSTLLANATVPTVTGYEGEQPVRKIEIISPTGQLFHRELTEMEVQVKLHPADASDQDIEWSVVNDVGIKTNIASIEGHGHRAKVRAIGDGCFRVRCTSKNGTDKIKLISELEMSANGLGVAYKNPYDFIQGGLYDYSKGEVGSGNERGVATSRDGETHVGYKQIDFGPIGSDLITIPIFAMSNEEYPIQIWEGIPGEAGSILLADVIYQKEPIWNVYQPATYKLAKRLTGLTTITFVLEKKIHIKGFSFEPYNRAFAKNKASEADHIYGDSFMIGDHAVEGIGNNVSLSFEAIDFGDQGMTKLVIYGHSPIDKNTIHVRFENGQSQVNQLIEFTQSEGYQERSFNLERVVGKQTVTFIFLPGSQFDFGWFKFE
ncbi:glycoside hydrolase family 2 TIM barrel-domain containing protein [Amphibacillus sediminis]|uniref:glycoside hydrolase family 2 TIM barrel-domain containing protein n=1 Tax=Amphibacillus sediminis TaxID=360185 RepID=UPI000830E41D|nr:glycoside hydrolase family 2 TIM barrel-domain containing protein [Amphibacillus sediminis]